MSKTTRALLVLLFIGWVGLVPIVRHTLYRGLYLLAMGHLGQFHEFLLSLGPWAAAVSTLLMISQSVAVPIPVTLLMVANGLVFGVWHGMLISFIGGFIGAVFAFYLGRRLGRTDPRLKAVIWHDKEDVHAGRSKHEGDHRGEKRAVFDVAAVDGEHQRVEVGLAKRDGDDRIDDVDDERGDHRSECDADDEGNGQLQDVALVEKVTKAFHAVLLLPLVNEINRRMRRPSRGSAS